MRNTPPSSSRVGCCQCVRIEKPVYLISFLLPRLQVYWAEDVQANGNSPRWNALSSISSRVRIFPELVFCSPVRDLTIEISSPVCCTAPYIRTIPRPGRLSPYRNVPSEFPGLLPPALLPPSNFFLRRTPPNSPHSSYFWLPPPLLLSLSSLLSTFFFFFLTILGARRRAKYHCDCTSIAHAPLLTTYYTLAIHHSFSPAEI